MSARARAARGGADDLLELLGLAGMADAPAGTLAHGDERRLGVARALATDPTFVLMDERRRACPKRRCPSSLPWFAPYATTTRPGCC